MCALLLRACISDPISFKSVSNVAFYRHIKCQMCDVCSSLTPTIIVLDIRGYNRLAWGDTAPRHARSVYKLRAEEGFLRSNNASQFLPASVLNANAANAANAITATDDGNRNCQRSLECRERRVVGVNNRGKRSPAPGRNCEKTPHHS